MEGTWLIPGRTQPVGGFLEGFISYGVPGAIGLEYNRRPVVRPGGIYTCQIPDESGQLETLYVGVGTGTAKGWAGPYLGGRKGECSLKPLDKFYACSYVCP